MAIPGKYSPDLSLGNRIMYIISVLKKPTADEVAMELMELQGISTEESVSELRRDTEQELKNLCNAGTIIKVKEHHQKTTYILPAGS